MLTFIFISWFAVGFLVTGGCLIIASATDSFPRDYNPIQLPILMIFGTALGYIMVVLVLIEYVKDKYCNSSSSRGK